jgi:tyrosine-protein kinase Etk/Wzc
MYKDDINSNLIGEENTSDNLTETVKKYIYHWPLFALSIFVLVFCSFLYLRYYQPVFSVNSTLLIKDNKKGGMPAENDLLNELDLLGSSKVVENEIEILKSKTLMRKVVNRLNLSVSFTAVGRVKNQDLYLNKPVNFGVVQINSLWYNKALDLSFPSADTYRLEDLESGQVIVGQLNQLQRNIFGIYKIDKNEDFNTLMKYPLTITIQNPVIVADHYLSQLSIGLSSKQSTVLNLNILTTIPEQGQDILNTLVQVYNEAALLDKNKTIQSTIEFIDERLKLINGELTEVEKDVEGFKSSRGITDISSDANLFLESVKTNDAKLNEVNLQISVINDIQRYINSNSLHEKLPSTLGISDPVLLGQISQLGELQLERDRLLTTTTENNPLLAPITKQIETTRAGIKSSISNILNTLQVSKANLEGNNSQFQGSIKKIPGQERQLISIKRQQSIKESLYLYLLQKKEEAALSYASSVADSRTVDPAFYSNSPVKPKRQLIYLAGAILGFLLAAGFIYLRELLNDKLEGAQDLNKLTSAPLLGEVLLSDDKTPIVVQHNSRKAIAEQFRAIRTNMQFLQGKRIPGKAKVTLFTSSMSGEGKSFVAGNISAALALSGKKTILLELDLRKPAISKYLQLNNNVGLSNYLIGKATIDEIIQSTTVDPNLFVISSGPIPPNPSELLVNTDIEILFEYLVNNYDEVLIDTPPIGLVTDAQILARLADATIYLVRQNVTSKDQIKRLDSLYRSNKFPKLNVIINGVKLGGAYGYGYGYYADDLRDTKFDLKRFVKELGKRL